MRSPRILAGLLATALLLLVALPIQAQSPISIDGVIHEGEYSGSATYAGGSFVLHWRTMGDRLYLAMEAKTTGWVSVGLEPEGRMQGADMLFGWVHDDGLLLQTRFSAAQRRTVRAVHGGWGAPAWLMAAQILLGLLMVLGTGGA